MKSPTHHLGYLDGVRALAALWVLFGHVALMVGSKVTDPRVAVDIFMVLSGYLMLYQSVVHDADHDFGRFSRGFFLRRFFRIAPLYYVLLIFSYLLQGSYLGWTAGMSAHPEIVRAAQRSAFTVPHAVEHFSFLYGFSPRFSVSTLMPDWSLTLEMQFYAFFPLLLLWFRRQSFLLPVLVLLAICLVVTPLLVPAFSFPTVLPMKLPLFLAGILLAWARWKTTSGAERILVVALVMLILGQKDRILAAMAATVLLCDFGGERLSLPGLGKLRGAAQAILSSAPLRKLADWSYGIYLVHPLILLPLLASASRYPAFQAQPEGIRFLFLGSMLFLTSIVVAAVLHRLVEIPGIEIGRWLEKRAGGSRRRDSRTDSSLSGTLPPYSAELVTLSPK